MELLILAIGAYLLWRTASESGKPSQEPSPKSLPEEPTKPLERRIFLDSRKVFLINRYTPLIKDVAAELGIDADIFRALIYVSSGGDEAVQIMQPDSEYGYGLTQITCSRARGIGKLYQEGVEEVGIDCRTLLLPINSIWYGGAYLRALYQGDWLAALAKYYSPTESLIPRADALRRARLTLTTAKAFRTIK
jgi:hypothetical protein